MFGFIGKFKNEVVAGFNSVHQRLITLEAKVDALFHHNTVVAEQAVKADVAPVEVSVEAVLKHIDEVKNDAA